MYLEKIIIWSLVNWWWLSWSALVLIPLLYQLEKRYINEDQRVIWLPIYARLESKSSVIIMATAIIANTWFTYQVYTDILPGGELLFFK